MSIRFLHIFFWIGRIVHLEQKQQGLFVYIFLENPLTIRTYCAIIILSAGRKVLNAENPVSRLGENDTEGVNDMSETAEVICQLIS